VKISKRFVECILGKILVLSVCADREVDCLDYGWDTLWVTDGEFSGFDWPLRLQLANRQVFTNPLRDFLVDAVTKCNPSYVIPDVVFIFQGLVQRLDEWFLVFPSVAQKKYGSSVGHRYKITPQIHETSSEKMGQSWMFARRHWGKFP
jgi:hypothetical protein